MKAKDLIKILKTHPNWDIVLSKDSEGNNFSPCFCAGENIYVPHSSYSGEVYSLDNIKMKKHDFIMVKNVPTEVQRAFVLWPTN